MPTCIFTDLVSFKILDQRELQGRLQLFGIGEKILYRKEKKIEKCFYFEYFFILCVYKRY